MTQLTNQLRKHITAILMLLLAGTYNLSVNAQHLVMKNSRNPTYPYLEPDKAAHTIQEAINAAKNNGGGTVTILDGGPYQENISLFSNIDLAGGWAFPRIIGKQAGVPVVTIVGANDVTITRCHISNGSAQNGAGIFVNNSTGIRIMGCFISDNTANNVGGGIYFNNSTGGIIKDSIFSNTAKFGGGIACMNGSTPTIIANNIAKNVAKDDGAGIWCDGVNTNPLIGASDGVNFLHENNADGNGGGIAVVNSSMPVIQYNCIMRNRADANGDGTGDGGGIWYRNAGSNLKGNNEKTFKTNKVSLLLNPGDIAFNTIQGNAAWNGGGIAVPAGSPVIISNLIGGPNPFDGNIAFNNGGGIWASGVGTNPTIGQPDNGNQIQGNHANVNGGGIACVAGACPLIQSNVICHNRADANGNATGDGGGIYCSGAGTNPRIDDNKIQSNEAENGGGVACTGDDPTIINNTIGGVTANEGNIANNDGGGIWVSGAGTDPAIGQADKGNSIERNQANGNGGGIACVASANPLIQKNVIRHNQADADRSNAGDGGGIYCDGAGTNPTIQNNTIQSNSAENGGGIAGERGSGATIIGNTIGGNGDWLGNKARTDGGGIYATSNLNVGSSNKSDGNRIESNIALNGNGGGICCTGSIIAPISPVIVNNNIRDNTADGNTQASNGGGIACISGGNATIYSNDIFFNLSKWNGGGIYCEFSSPIIGNRMVEKNIINANRAYFDGGGICCFLLSSPTISMNDLMLNEAIGDGGGIYSENSGPDIRNNWISANSAGHYGGNANGFGGGIGFVSSFGEITGNFIGKCFADSIGGGIALTMSSNPNIDHNTLWNNDAIITGGGMYWDASSSASITYNIVRQFGCYDASAICSQVQPQMYEFNDVYNTIGPLYDLQRGILPIGVGNISADPIFRAPENSKFTLCDNSPCLLPGNQFIGAFFSDNAGPRTVRTLYVPNQYQTIQSALDAAQFGDAVSVAAGTYSGFTMKRGVILTGELAPDDGPDLTIIDGSVQCESLDHATVISGFTVRGNITCSQSADPYIIRNLIHGSLSVIYDVSNISEPSSRPWIEHNTIVRSGVALENTAPVLSYNIISSISATPQNGLVRWIPNLRGNDVMDGYSGMEDQTGINGNISANPLFVDGATNFRLQEDSPCAPYNSPTRVLIGAFPVEVKIFLISPVNASTVQQNNLTLVWSDVQNAQSYIVQVSQDAAFTSLVVTQASIQSSRLAIPSGTLRSNTTYYWRVRVVTKTGLQAQSTIWNFTTETISDVTENLSEKRRFYLSQNYPNPFNPATSIGYSLSEASTIDLSVFDLRGEKITTLVSGRREAGEYRVQFDGVKVPSAKYIYRLVTERGEMTKSMLLIK